MRLWKHTFHCPWCPTLRRRIDAVAWDVKALFVAPKVFDDPQHSTNDVKAIFYEGLPWKGNPTRVFAYCGVPKTDGKTKVPAMVLVHGGDGSAFVPWVRLWVSRGYAAIAMDTCGCIRRGVRHEYGGPMGWGGSIRLISRLKINGPITPSRMSFSPIR